uniref:FPL domain-containing protein n=1 Tax=Brassica campestris TaxID=3711 RepID=M4D6R4_BRACM
MWFSFLRPRDRFSLLELRFFMEKQVMGEFVRILRVSKTVAVSVQLLQTMSIMIQNLTSDQAIYYLFSNEYVNYLITYTFDFQHEELLSYYISFLRAVSGKLNRHTISLLLKTENDVVVSFPLYVQGIQFAFHEENMIRTAVRALTLNVYHVGDESVNDYVVSQPHTEYFSKLVSFFQKQCMDLSAMVLNTLKFGNGHPDNGVVEEADQQCSSTEVLNEDGDCNENTTKSTFNNSHITFRETLLQYISEGDDVQAQGSLFVLATLLQTKELEESVLDAFGILPQRKQHKKLLLQSLVGEDSGEEQLFSPQNGSMRDGLSSELDWCLRKLEVVDALVSLLCRENISAETLWDGGWLLRQLLPYSEAEFNLIEAPSPQKEPKSVILQLDRSACNENTVSESSFTAGEKLCEVIKVFVLLHQLKIFSLGRPLPEQPPIHPPADRSETSRATTAGLDLTVPKPGTEVKLVDAVPCRIAFERGKERNFSFLALSSSSGVSGWIVLAEESLLKPDHGTVRVTAPLAGCNPRIDEKHPKWLHLRIRPSTLPFLDPTKRGVYEKLKSKGLVDGRWTLAFRDDDSCSSACSMVVHEIDLQCREVERRLKPLFDLDRNHLDQSNVTSHAFSSSTSSS